MKRLVASLVVNEKGAWITEKYKPKIYLGEPSNIIRMLNEMRADEASISWIGKNKIDRDSFLKLISSQAAMPLSFGGGIQSPEDALEVVRLGFDKVVVTSAFIQDPKRIRGIASKVGRSSVSIKLPLVEKLDRLAVLNWRTNTFAKNQLSTYLRALEYSEVSEVIFSLVDRTGMQSGVEPSVVELLTSQVPVLTGYEGGVRNTQEVEKLWDLGIDGVYASSLISTYGPLRAPLTFYPQIRPERFA